MKLGGEIWKTIVSQSSYFKSRLDPGELRGGAKILETLRVEGSG